MNESLAQQLSAYHDGELTVAERAELERQLAASPEGRHALASLRRLSDAVQQVPRPTVDAAFTADVMARLVRPPVVQPTTTAPRANARGTRQWLAVFSAAAAAVLLAVIFMPQGNQQPNQEVAHVEPAALQTANSALNPTEAVSSTGAQQTAAVVAQPTMTTSQADFEFVADLRKAQPGELVDALKRTGGKVAVVHLVVVDLQPGFDSLQVLLAEHKIGPSSGGKTHAAQTHVAVLVKANETELDDVLRGLKYQPQFVAAAVEPAHETDAISHLADTRMTGRGQLPLSDETELKQLGVEAASTVEIAKRLPAPGRISRAPGSLPANTLGNNDGQKPEERKVLFVLTQGALPGR